MWYSVHAHASTSGSEPIGRFRALDPAEGVREKAMCNTSHSPWGKIRPCPVSVQIKRSSPRVSRSILVNENEIQPPYFRHPCVLLQYSFMAERGLAYLKEQYLWGPGSQVVELFGGQSSVLGIESFHKASPTSANPRLSSRCPPCKRRGSDKKLQIGVKTS